MIIPCEMAVKAIIPTVRAMVAKELSHSYRMRQDDIASVLGITQSAVSQYLNNIRGKALNIEGVKEVETVVKDIAYILINKSPTQKIICKKYCETCRIIREKRILCQLHKRLDPMFNTTDCDLCMPDAISCF